MERIDFSYSMIRGLKGAPLSVLMIMAMVGTPVTAEFLERHTGYTDKPVNAALLLLQESGLITRNDRYSWRIAIKVTQLPLMTLPEEENIQSEPTDNQSVSQVDEVIEGENGTRNYSDSELFRVPSSRYIEINPLDNNQEPLLLDAAESEKLRVAENLAACDQYGIREPKRSKISKKQTITARLIRYHCDTAKNIPLAIYRIEHGWGIKSDWIDPADQPDYSMVINCDNQKNVCAQTFSSLDLDLWQALLESVRPDFREADYITWLMGAELVEITPDCWTIGVANRFAAEWIKINALEKLQTAAGVIIKVVGGL